MIDALQDGPGPARRPAANTMGRRVALIERLDGQAVIGLAFELLEWRALEHGIDQLAPVRVRCGREIAGQREGFGSRHGSKLPCRVRRANTRAACRVKACNWRAGAVSRAAGRARA